MVKKFDIKFDYKVAVRFSLLILNGIQISTSDACCCPLNISVG